MADTNQQLGINLLLLEGHSDGPLHIKIPDTIYDLYIVPRKHLEKYRGHKKMNLAGIYFVIGDPDGEDVNLYIGQASVRKNEGGTIKHVRENIRNGKHTYCQKTIMLVAPPESFSATELNLLEGTFIDLAKAAGRMKLSNLTSAPSVVAPEHLRNRISKIVSNTRLMLTTMGIMILEPAIPQTSSDELEQIEADDEGPIASVAPSRDISPEFYNTRLSSNRATLVRSGNEWVLKAGSSLGNGTGDNMRKWRKRYAHLITDGLTTADIPFPSPNLAGSFVTGNTANANKYWVDAHGKTLGEYRELGEI